MTLRAVAQSSGSGSSALSSITAAVGANTIANSNNTGQVWNWANTTDATIAFTFGETSAASGGTSTSGIPNQVLLKIATLATSTEAPISVYSRGTHVFSVSPTAAQILLNAATQNNPALAPTGSVNTGIFFTTATPAVKFAVAGSVVQNILAAGIQVPPGTATVPSVTDFTTHTGGLAWNVAANSVSILSNSLEQIRITPGVMQFIAAGFSTANGTVATAMSNLGPAAANTTIQEWLTITMPSGTVRFIPCF